MRTLLSHQAPTSNNLGSRLKSNLGSRLTGKLSNRLKIIILTTSRLTRIALLRTMRKTLKMIPKIILRKLTLERQIKSPNRLGKTKRNRMSRRAVRIKTMSKMMDQPRGKPPGVIHRNSRDRTTPEGLGKRLSEM